MSIHKAIIIYRGTLTFRMQLFKHLVSFIFLIIFLLVLLSYKCVLAQDFPGKYTLTASKTKIKHDDEIILTFTLTPAYSVEKTYYIMLDTTYVNVSNGNKWSGQINAGETKKLVFKIRPKKNLLRAKIPVRVYFNWRKFSMTGWLKGLLLEIINFDKVNENYLEKKEQTHYYTIYSMPDTVWLLISNKSKGDTLRLSLPAIMENDTLWLYLSDSILGGTIKNIIVKKMGRDSLIMRRNILKLKADSAKRDTVKPVGIPVFKKN